MKNSVFKILFVLVIILISFGCVKEKTFNEDDFKITLTNEFREKKNDMFTYYYQNGTVIVTVLKEDITDLESININNETSTKEYLQTAAKINNKEYDIVDEDNYSYMEYEATDYYHLAASFKSNDSFWNINFMCLKADKNKYKDEFKKWIKTIEV